MLEVKHCSRCAAEKPLALFYRDSNPKNKSGRQSRCIECCKADAIAYAKAHPEWKRAKDKRYAQRHPDKVRERSARRRKEDPDYWRNYTAKYRAEWRKKHPEQDATTSKAYRQRNPAIIAERMAQYVHAKRRPLEWADRDKMRVVYAKAKEFGMEVDHVVPLRSKLVSGLHVWHNLQLLARDENRRKRNRHWPEMPCGT